MPTEYTSNFNLALPDSDHLKAVLKDIRNSFTVIDSTLAIQKHKLSDADGDTYIDVEASADEDVIRMKTAGAERLVIGKDGKIGIGTNSPLEQLHLTGNLQLENNQFIKVKTAGGIPKMC